MKLLPATRELGITDKDSLTMILTFGNALYQGNFFVCKASNISPCQPCVKKGELSNIDPRVQA